jgi:phage tail sheath protein FI
MVPINRPPGVHIDEVSGPKAIAEVPTSVTVFIGWTPQGPTDRAEPVSAWSDYQDKFGGLDRDSLISYAVHFFFVNGGMQAYVIRLASAEEPKAKSPLRSIDIRAGAKGVVLGPLMKRAGSVMRPNTPQFAAGLRAALPLLDGIDLFNLLCVPGETEEGAVRELEEHCYDRRAFLILDCHEDDTHRTIADRSTDNISVEPAAANAAIYYPWVKAQDPLDPKSIIVLPPSCFVLGVIARTDSERGFWKAPSLLEAKLLGAVGLKEEADHEQLDELDAMGVNCMRKLIDDVVVWGARTLLGSNERASEWKYIPVRRTALFIGESISRGTEWVAFEQNDEALWSRIRSLADAFMNDLYRQRAFQGSTPRDAYFVKCDRETTTQDDIDHGFVNILVGFAPMKPAEFVVIRLRRSAAR